MVKEKKTTKIALLEYFIYLIISLIIYVLLHLAVEPNKVISIPSGVRYTITQQIDDVQESLQDLSGEDNGTVASILSPEEIQDWETNLANTDQNKKFNEDIFSDLKDKLDKPLNEENRNDVSDLLNQLMNSLKPISFFWTDERKWIEVLFWSLFGTLFYIMKQITDYYIRDNIEIFISSSFFVIPIDG